MLGELQEGFALYGFGFFVDSLAQTERQRLGSWKNPRFDQHQEGKTERDIKPGAISPSRGR